MFSNWIEKNVREMYCKCSGRKQAFMLQTTYVEGHISENSGQILESTPAHSQQVDGALCPLPMKVTEF